MAETEKEQHDQQFQVKVKALEQQLIEKDIQISSYQKKEAQKSEVSDSKESDLFN